MTNMFYGIIIMNMCLIMLSILTFIVATEDQKAVLQLQFENIRILNLRYILFQWEILNI